jgi:hypothetical protein
VVPEVVEESHRNIAAFGRESLLAALGVVDSVSVGGKETVAFGRIATIWCT